MATCACWQKRQRFSVRPVKQWRKGWFDIHLCFVANVRPQCFRLWPVSCSKAAPGGHSARAVCYVLTAPFSPRSEHMGWSWMAEADIEPPVGSVENSHDTGLAETINSVGVITRAPIVGFDGRLASLLGLFVIRMIW